MPHLNNIVNESINSSLSMDPAFIPTINFSQRRVDNQNTATKGCTGGASSYQSSLRGMDREYYGHMDQDEVFYNTNESGASLLDIEDYKKIKKRMQNKESAVRSRMKRKAYYDNIEVLYNQLQLESNKLKLDNAALRAENQLLKRYLNYFENLFAKKTQ